MRKKLIKNNIEPHANQKHKNPFLIVRARIIMVPNHWQKLWLLFSMPIFFPKRRRQNMFVNDFMIISVSGKRLQKIDSKTHTFRLDTPFQCSTDLYRCFYCDTNSVCSIFRATALFLSLKLLIFVRNYFMQNISMLNSGCI